MDAKNPFESPVTFKLHRAEYLAGFVLSIVLILIHIQQIRWVPFAVLFLYIDLIGYIPGAIAFRRSPDGRIPRHYYVLYNSMHSLISCGAVAGLWMWLYRPEWALLALPFHVLGDRGVFGNFLKTFGRPFEPVDTDPLYTKLAHALSERGSGSGPVPAAPTAAPVQVRTEAGPGVAVTPEVAR
jgi:hypothetical protein